MDIITTLDGMKSMKVLFALPILFLFIRVGYQIAYVKDYMKMLFKAYTWLCDGNVSFKFSFKVTHFLKVIFIFFSL